MKLTPEQQAAVSSWIAAGDNLSAVQKKLREQFSVSLTYMDVRFVVDDLNLNLKDPAPKANANDVTKAVPAARSPAPAPKPKAAPAPGDAPVDEDGVPLDDEGAALDAEAELEDDLPEDAAIEDDAVPAGGPTSITVEVDKVTLNPSAMASGSVTFSDGVTAKWIVDNYGRPGFTEVSQAGYRPTSADAQAFMQELSAQLQKRGF